MNRPNFQRPVSSAQQRPVSAMRPVTRGEKAMQDMDSQLFASVPRNSQPPSLNTRQRNAANPNIRKSTEVAKTLAQYSNPKTPMSGTIMSDVDEAIKAVEQFEKDELLAKKMLIEDEFEASTRKLDMERMSNFHVG
eukprot:NODE_6109_length_925_cov_25.789277_g5518_i0.p1 GENE.NODE_6109_length_925_cov_25.789277_g5518_i0~~NODE_6109_length_925_cov_25.789277_g5518_i0.p1  ORF type:complete len:136 (-),score=30.75 NODE_6109_length_925_cov_25.789277_g5518_i0:468-875(-)